MGPLVFLNPSFLVDDWKGSAGQARCLEFDCSFSSAWQKTNQKKTPVSRVSCASPNRAMQQELCSQARRNAKRGAQQSSDCEHLSKLCNAAWRHKAPLHRPVYAAGAFGNSLRSDPPEAGKQSAPFFRPPRRCSARDKGDNPNRLEPFNSPSLGCLRPIVPLRTRTKCHFQH